MRHAIWICAVILSFAAGWSGVVWLTSPPARPPEVLPPRQQQSISTELASPEHPRSSHASQIGTQASTDPIAALLEQPSGLARDHALFTAIRSWQPADFPNGADGMLELIKKNGNGIGSVGEHLTEAWLDRWLEIDAPAALAYLESSSFLSEIPAIRSTSSVIQSPLGGAFRALLRHRPEWLRTQVLNMESGTPRTIAAQVLIALVGRGGLAQAQPYLADFPQMRGAALAGYVREAAGSSPLSALEAVLTEPAGQFRETLLSEIFNAAAARDLSAARSMLDRIEDPALRLQMAESTLSGADGSDPKEILDLVREESERLIAAGKHGPDAVLWIRSGLYGQTAESLQALADWSAGLAADPDRALLTDITRHWASRDAPRFLAWLGANASRLDSAIIGKLSYAMNDMAANGSAAMEEWAATLPDGPLRNQALFQLSLRSTSEADLASAQAAYRALADLDTTGALAGQLAGSLLESDPALAAEWALRHTTGTARDVALRNIAERWSMSDPQAAGHWVAQIPAGRDRDIVVQKYATSAMLADPLGAAEWALQINDAKAREATMDSVMHAWQIWDPVAARAWYRRAPGLGDKALQKVLRLAQ